MFKDLILDEKINSGRQKEIDLFRGFTAIVLILCHVSLYLGDNGDNALFVFGDIIGSEFGAPVFMAMMGMSIVYSKNNDPNNLLKRGILLFISGYILNIVRSLLAYIIMPDMDYFSTLESLFLIDILPFAGLSFILISLFKRLKLNSLIILLISLVFAFVDQFFFNLASPITDNKALTCLLNIFIPVDDYSCFPFLTWFFFPALGLFLGDILIRTENKNKLYKIYLVIGLIGVLIVYGSFIYLYPDYTSYYYGNNFYYMGVLNLIINGLLICFGLSFWYFISKIMPSFIDKYLVFLSKNLNVFYWISWIIIGSMIHIITYNNIVFETYIVIMLMILIQALTSLLTFFFIKVKSKLLIRKNK